MKTIDFNHEHKFFAGSILKSGAFRLFYSSKQLGRVNKWVDKSEEKDIEIQIFTKEQVFKLLNEEIEIEYTCLLDGTKGCKKMIARSDIGKRASDPRLESYWTL